MSYKIPLFDLNFDEAENRAVVETLNSKWISSGPKCLELETKFAHMLGVKYALAVSNCTAALHLAMVCAGIKPGDEVIVPSLTFVATVNTVRYVGGIPVFADIVSRENLCLDPAQVEALITPRTKAITVMHYGGFACDMDKIMDIARVHGLKVIEDACHGPMSEYQGKKLGTIGDVGCFSFFSNKNISTGEGGMLVTNDEHVYEQAKLLRSHGMTTMSYARSTGHSTSYDVVGLGYNYRFNDILASIGIVQLDKLMPDIIKRKHLREIYIRMLGDDERILIPFKEYKNVTSSYVCPIVLADGNAEKRDAIRDYLAQKGVQTSVHYPPAHRFDIYKGFHAELPVTDYVADNEFTLPMYGSLTDENAVYVAESVKEALDNIIGEK